MLWISCRIIAGSKPSANSIRYPLGVTNVVVCSDWLIRPTGLKAYGLFLVFWTGHCASGFVTIDVRARRSNLNDQNTYMVIPGFPRVYLIHTVFLNNTLIMGMAGKISLNPFLDQYLPKIIAHRIIDIKGVSHMPVFWECRFVADDKLKRSSAVPQLFLDPFQLLMGIAAIRIIPVLVGYYKQTVFPLK